MIKKLNIQHLNQIYSLSKNSFNGESWFTKTHFKNILYSNTCLCLGSFYTSNNKEQLNGFLLLYVLEPPKIWVEVLLVDQPFRRQKIATKLLETALKKIKKDKYFLLLVDVSKKDEFQQAQKFWIKNHFIENCVIKDWYGKNDDAILYTRHLS